MKIRVPETLQELYGPYGGQDVRFDWGFGPYQALDGRPGLYIHESPTPLDNCGATAMLAAAGMANALDYAGIAARTYDYSGRSKIHAMSWTTVEDFCVRGNAMPLPNNSNGPRLRLAGVSEREYTGRKLAALLGGRVADGQIEHPMSLDEAESFHELGFHGAARLVVMNSPEITAVLSEEGEQLTERFERAETSGDPKQIRSAIKALGLFADRYDPFASPQTFAGLLHQIPGADTIARGRFFVMFGNRAERLMEAARVSVRSFADLPPFES